MPRGFDMDDLDGDGRPEVAVANSNSNSVSVYRNTSSPGSFNSGSLATKVDFTTGSTPYDVEIGDLDKDGKPDLVVANAGAASISVYRNTSTPGVINSGSFAARVDFSTGGNPYDVELCDMDGDGLMDILVASNTIGVSIHRNISTPGTINAGSFGARVDFVTANGPYKVAIGDLDGDQKPDLAVACYFGQAISVLRNTSTPGSISAGSFASKVDFATPAGNYDMVLADFDGDGKPDMASGTDNANHISIFKNNATSGALSIASFGARIDISSGAYSNILAAGDIDNDGKPELIGGGERVTVLRNMVLATEPTSQPTNLTFFHITSTAFDGSWTEPVPQPDGYLAVMSGTVAPNFIPVDGIAYNIDLVGVGTVLGHTMYIVQNSSEPGIDLSGLASENIFIKVYAFNGTGPTTNYLTTAPLSGSQVPTLDTNKPTVTTNLTPAIISPGADLVVSGNFADVGSGVDFVTLEYRPIAGVLPNNFFSVQMLAAGDPKHEYTIPGGEVTELGMEFRFLVHDFEGNDNSVAQTTYTSRVRYEGDDELQIPYPNEGRTIQNYRIISVPLILDDMSFNTVLGSTLGPYDNTIWAAYRWNGTRLDEMNNDSQMEIGKGYWFITETNVGDGMYTGPGVTPDVSPSNPFQITLTPGWNQIGNPYNFHISWNDILQANPTQQTALGGTLSKIRVFRGTVDNVDELVTFEGGFVKNTSASNITIDIPVAKNPAINSRKAIAGPLRNAIDQSNWEINFNLSQGATTYNLGGLGMRPDAELAYDNYDDFNLPRFFEYLEVKFPKERVGMTYTKDVVPTANQFVWEFTVESNIAEGPIQMGWDNSYYGDVKEIYLVDLVEHRAINMRENDSYAFVAGPSRLFKVVFGDSEFVKNEVLPGQPVLFSPYPNPFVDRVTIGYTLPKEAVTQGAAVDIYSGQGVRVSTVDLPAQAGEGSWEWVSQPQTPGMYFVRLRVGDQTVVKKIIKQ